jgi:hypothetical protein
LRSALTVTMAAAARIVGLLSAAEDEIVNLRRQLDAR